MRKQKLSGQILIVLLLALAIISVLLVLISRNTRRDTIDQIQSEQYEDYYSAVEKELFQIISGGSKECNLTYLDQNGFCDIVLSSLTNKRGLSAKNLRIEKKDVVNFTNLVIGKDKNITIKLKPDDGNPGYIGDLKFSWKGSVAWVVNIDYQTATGEYKTTQSIYDKFNIFDDSANLKNCLSFVDEGTNSFSFNIEACLNTQTITPYDAIAVRMKPITTGSSTELTLIDSSTGLPPQARIITATADIDDNLPNSPSIQLELQIPTQNPSLEILDYALRTNKIVYKHH